MTKTLSISLSSVYCLIMVWRHFERFRKLHPPLSGQSEKLARDIRVPIAKKVAALAAEATHLDVLVRVLTNERLRRLVRLVLNAPHRPLSAVIRTNR